MAEPSAVPASFESALAELESIVATMEGGQLPLAESLAAYKRGAELLQFCQAVAQGRRAAGSDLRERRAEGA
jgi:exodeoxyribonuclease VII small subunit